MHRTQAPRLFFKPSGYRWRSSKAVMLARKVVNAEMQRDGWLVRFQVFAVA
jgi:hypothetical protein